MSLETDSVNYKNLHREPRLKGSVPHKDISLITHPSLVRFRRPDAVELSHRIANIQEIGGKIVLELGDDKGTNQINLSRKEKVLAEFFIENYLKGQPTHPLQLKSHIEKAIRAEGKKWNPLEFAAKVRSYEEQIKSKLRGKLKKAKWEILPVEKDHQGRLSYDLRRMEDAPSEPEVPTKKNIKSKKDNPTKPVVIFPKKPDDGLTPEERRTALKKEESLNKTIEKSATTITRQFIFLLSNSNLLNVATHDLNIFLAICLEDDALREDVGLKKHKAFIVKTIQSTLEKALGIVENDKKEMPLSFFARKRIADDWERLKIKYPDYNIQKFMEQFSSHFGIQLPETIKTNESTSSPGLGSLKD